ncbi:MAG TPA: RNA polymerase sigma factor [Anaerolineales bacterium]|nr:RNA polymerase sigma factor [Anaerolineales bacterium]
MDDEQIIVGLKQREEATFLHLINTYHASMVRIAMLYVPNMAAAEEIAQETWLKVLEGIEQFERRSTLKTWIYAILMNLARSRGKREGRCIPFSNLENCQDEDVEPSVPAERFFPADHDQWPNEWSAPPEPWEYVPEEYLQIQELRDCIHEALEHLTENQRTVITLHDLEGWSSIEICNTFNISETNLRVLLHRARARLRQALETFYRARLLI